ELFGDLAVAHPCGDETQNLELPRRDPQLLAAPAVNDERRGGWDVNLFDNDSLRTPGQLGAQPDAERGEKQGDEARVDLDRVVDDEKAVLDRLETGDEESAEKAVEEDGAAHALRSLRRSGRPASRAIRGPLAFLNDWTQTNPGLKPHPFVPANQRAPANHWLFGANRNAIGPSASLGSSFFDRSGSI